MAGCLIFLLHRKSPRISWVLKRAYHKVRLVWVFTTSTPICQQQISLGANATLPFQQAFLGPYQDAAFGVCIPGIELALAGPVCLVWCLWAILNTPFSSSCGKIQCGRSHFFPCHGFSCVSGHTLELLLNTPGQILSIVSFKHQTRSRIGEDSF